MTFMEAWLGLSLQGRGLFKSWELRIEKLSALSWLAVNLGKSQRKWTGNHTHHLEFLSFPASGVLALGEGRVGGGGDWDGTGHTLLTTEVTPPGHGGGWPGTAACVAPPAAPGCPIAGHQPAAAQSPATQVLERGTLGDGYVRHRGGALSAR